MNLSEHIALNRELAECVCRRLCEEINKLGFMADDSLHYPHYDKARFELLKDPFTGDYNLTGYWHDEAKKQRIGQLQFNSDGSFYAEYDVIKPHPTKPRHFVEGVTAWGKAEQIKAEAKLLDMPE
ncbi:MAG: hypothetical protein ACNA7G_04240 [Methylobacter sp.]